MRTLIFLTFSFSLFSCSSQEKDTPITINTPSKKSRQVKEEVDPSVIDTLSLGLNFTPQGTYNSTKAAIADNIAKGLHSKEHFEDYLLNQIIPFWYGTPWDFNGYTAIPQQGEIACGYFVSTTLLHVGINLNRYHLAQQAGLNEAKSLAITEDKYETIWGLENLNSAIENRYRDGVYFIGLDNHVGFLYIKNKEIYFIHSNYIEDRVMIEKANTSIAFQSDIYVIGEISTNEALLEKWRKKEVVKIYRN